MERFSVRNCANHLRRLLASKGCFGAFISRALVCALIARRPHRRGPCRSCPFRQRAARRSSAPASFSLRCGGGLRRLPPGRSRGSGWPVRAAFVGSVPACCEPWFSPLVTVSCAAFGGRFGPNRDIWRSSRRMFHHCADMFNKMFRPVFTCDSAASFLSRAT